jgi:maltose alpha-D-glucosyltransferase/alpha-amylase
MQWSGDRNAGFSETNPQRLFLPVVIDPEYHYEAVNVEAQQGNPSSLLWWMKRLIRLRKRHASFSRGTIEFLRPSNRRVLAYLRRYESERILVIANLSRYAQFAELDLAEFQGTAPIELIGGGAFPVITEKPWLVTLGPHSFFWFQLGERAPALAVSSAAALDPIRLERDWTEIFEEGVEKKFAHRLGEFIQVQRWFRSKARSVVAARIEEAVPLRVEGQEFRLVFAQIDFKEGVSETYMIPLGHVTGREAARVEKKRAEAIVTRVEVDGEPGVLQDAAANPRVAAAILEAIRERRRLRGRAGEIRFIPEKRLKRLIGDGTPASRVLNVEQSNTTIAYGESLALKLFRRVEEGTSLELEIGRFLDARLPEGRIPPLAGVIEYVAPKKESRTLAVLTGYLTNEGNAWSIVLDYFARFLEEARALAASALAMPPLDPAFAEFARLLGVRTGELHVAFASAKDDPAFASESFSPHDQRALYQSFRNLVNEVFRALEARIEALDERRRPAAEAIRGKATEILKRFRVITTRRFTALKCRAHGDLHLGQVLYTGKDFVIMDFEGEPSRSLSERRLKRSPIRDVAGMVRSFHYAAHAATRSVFEDGGLPAEHVVAVRERMDGILDAAVGIYLDAYLDATAGAAFMPKSMEEFNLLYEIFLLEKAVYELGYELNNRPDWIEIPIEGIMELLE